MTETSRRDTHHAGFSLLELMIVVAITMVLAGAAVLTSNLAIETAKADSAAEAVVRELREARERAISDRRNIRVEFIAPNQIRTTRRDVVGTTEVGTTVLKTMALEGRFQFRLPPGAADTPDGFGNAADVDFGAATSLLFTSEGTFVDQTGDALNGTVFVSDPTNDLALRAVTIFGPTALVRAWRWNGSAWAE